MCLNVKGSRGSQRWCCFYWIWRFKSSCMCMPFDNRACTNAHEWKTVLCAYLRFLSCCSSRNLNTHLPIVDTQARMRALMHNSDPRHVHWYEESSHGFEPGLPRSMTPISWSLQSFGHLTRTHPWFVSQVRLRAALGAQRCQPHVPKRQQDTSAR